MSSVVVSLVCVAVAARMIAVEPRRVRIGFVLLFAALSLTGTIMSGFGDQLRAVFGLDSMVAMAWSVTMLGAALLFVAVLTVMLLINGVVMIRREGLAAAHVLSLALGVGITAYVAVGLVAAFSGNVQLVMYLCVLIFPIVLAAFSLVAYIGWAYGYDRLVRLRPGRITHVVVLGAGVAHGVRPLLASRISVGMQWATRLDARLVCSGGQGPDEPTSEAFAMAQYAQAQGYVGEILQEGRSTTTEENVRFTQQLLPADARVAVVTSNYHAFRAALLLREMNVAGIAVGAPVARYYWPCAVLREFVAVCRDHRATTLTLALLSFLPLLGTVVISLVS
ncbi:YdcF family protein [Corynebacterium aquilae]|uniref:YdcF family protein n=1 Tax=Corynebacterium aquilae TaxID=203263 RepID=UPI0012ECDCA0|nr:YdcF family protein [Corynebacterium aquilae]